MLPAPLYLRLTPFSYALSQMIQIYDLKTTTTEHIPQKSRAASLVRKNWSKLWKFKKNCVCLALYFYVSHCSFINCNKTFCMLLKNMPLHFLTVKIAVVQWTALMGKISICPLPTDVNCSACTYCKSYVQKIRNTICYKTESCGYHFLLHAFTVQQNWRVYSNRIA